MGEERWKGEGGREGGREGRLDEEKEWEDWRRVHIIPYLVCTIYSTETEWHVCYVCVHTAPLPHHWETLLPAPHQGTVEMAPAKKASDNTHTRVHSAFIQ